MAGAGDVVQSILAAPVGVAHGGVEGAVDVVGKGLREGVEVVGLVPLGGGAGRRIAVDAEEQLGVVLFRQGVAGGQLHLGGAGGVDEVDIGPVGVLQHVVKALGDLLVDDLFRVGGQVARRAVVRAAVAGVDDDAGPAHIRDVVEPQGEGIAVVAGLVPHHPVLLPELQGQLGAVPGGGGEEGVLGQLGQVAAHRLGVGEVKTHAAGGVGGVVGHRLGHGEDDVGIAAAAGDGHPLDDVVPRLLAGGTDILGVDPQPRFQQVIAVGVAAVPVDDLVPHGVIQGAGGEGEAVGAGDVVHGVGGEGLGLGGLDHHRVAGADGRLLVHRHRGAGGGIGKALVAAAEGDGPQLLHRGGGLRGGKVPAVFDIGGGLVGVVPLRLGLGQGDGTAPQAGGDAGTGVGAYRDGDLHPPVHRDAAGGGGGVLIQHLHLAGDVVGHRLALVGEGEGVQTGLQLLGHREVAALVGGDLLVPQGHLLGGVAGPLEHHAGLVGGVGGLLRLGELQFGEDELGAGLVPQVLEDVVGGPAGVGLEGRHGVEDAAAVPLHLVGVVQLADHLGVGAPAGVVAAAHPVGGVDQVHGDAVGLCQAPPPGGHHVEGGDPVPGGPKGLHRHKVELLFLDHGLDVGVAAAQHRPAGGGVGASLVLGLVLPHRVGEDAHLHPRGLVPDGIGHRVQRHPGKGAHVVLVADAAPLGQVGAVGGGVLLVVIFVKENTVGMVVGDELPRLLPEEVDGGGVQAGGPAHGLAVAHVHGVVDAVDIHPLGPGLGDGVLEGIEEGGEGGHIAAVVDDAPLARRLDDGSVETHPGGPADDRIDLRLHLFLAGVPGEEVLAGDEVEALHLVRLIIGIDRLLRLPLVLRLFRVLGLLGPVAAGDDLPAAGLLARHPGGTGIGKKGRIVQLPQKESHRPHDHDDAGKQAGHQGHQSAVVPEQFSHGALPPKTSFMTKRL